MIYITLHKYSFKSEQFGQLFLSQFIFHFHQLVDLRFGFANVILQVQSNGIEPGLEYVSVVWFAKTSAIEFYWLNTILET